MTQSQSAVQSFFSGGKGKYAKFENIGDKITGKILMVHPPEDATDPMGKVKTDRHGNPMKQLRIELETEERNPDIEFDDGVRTVYVQSFMSDAIKDALRRAGAQVPEVGGTLTVALSTLEPNPGLNPSKRYTAEYAAPTQLATGEFFGTTTSAEGGRLIPQKPDSIAQAAWDQMPDNVKASVAATMGSDAGPPF